MSHQNVPKPAGVTYFEKAYLASKPYSIEYTGDDWYDESYICNYNYCDDDTDDDTSDDTDDDTSDDRDDDRDDNRDDDYDEDDDCYRMPECYQYWVVMEEQEAGGYLNYDSDEERYHDMEYDRYKKWLNCEDDEDDDGCRKSKYDLYRDMMEELEERRYRIDEKIYLDALAMLPMVMKVVNSETFFYKDIRDIICGYIHPTNPCDPEEDTDEVEIIYAENYDSGDEV
jgi:hypothetical protein